MCRSGRVQSGLCLPSRVRVYNFRIMVGSASGPGSTFKAFLGSARVRVPLSNKIRVRVGSVQHIYGSLRVRVRIFGPVKTSTVRLFHSRQMTAALFRLAAARMQI